MQHAARICQKLMNIEFNDTRFSFVRNLKTKKPSQKELARHL